MCNKSTVFLHRSEKLDYTNPKKYIYGVLPWHKIFRQ